jgi:hypothetical protein
MASFSWENKKKVQGKGCERRFTGKKILKKSVCYLTGSLRIWQ